MIRIAGIKVSTARINLDAVVGRVPSGIIVSLGDHIIRFSIRLKSMLCARTPAGGNNDRYQQNRHHPRSRHNAVTRCYQHAQNILF
jgi:hypothetical protein